ncbi:TonB-dependent receptor plug domain-containing protein [Methylocystis echinoides]|uniref:TonB-dependent receptor n=1 Tax=Methylocystis echinoides TaxID=29468 RepID=A0A9W6GRI7_9HYPH|nr:TonB-dependent receptor [Methylocystis echinoides]GLI91757.1 TonB-dependent receptor [Methylocystis echinoides]
MTLPQFLRGGASAVALLCVFDSAASAQQALPTISIGPARPGLSRGPSVSHGGSGARGSGPTTAAPQLAQVQEVVVETATRTQKKVSEAPGDLTVFSENYIQRRDAPRIGAIIRDAPGIYSWGNSLGYASPSANRAGRFSFRGISGQNRTLFLLDDQIMNDPMFGSFNYAQYFMDDIQRIETLPGASSALYGANAYAGVVRAFSVVPEKREVLARGETTFGEFSRQSGDVIYRDRLPNGLGWSAGGRWEGSVPFRDNIIQRALVPPYVAGAVPTVTSQGQSIWNLGLQGEAKYRDANAHLKLYYDYDAATSVRGGVSYFLANSMQGYFESYAPLSSYQRYNAAVTPANRLTPSAFLGAGLAYETTLTAFGSARHRFSEESEVRLNINNMARVYRFTTPSVAPNSNAWALGGDGVYNNYPQNLFSANVQYTFPVKFLPFFAHQFTTGAGVDNGVAAFQSYNVKDWTNFGSSTAFTGSMQGQSRFVWGFVQDEIKVTPWLTAYLGGRVDWWTTSGVRASSTAPMDRFAEQGVVNFNPKVSLVANMPWPDGVLRASAGRAFRPPTLNALYVDSTRGNVRSFSNPDLKPETAISWEVGYEQYFQKTGTFAKATFFESWLSDYNSVRRLPAPTIIQTWSTTVNTGEAVVRGFEITGSQTLTDWLTAYVTYTNVFDATTLEAPDQPETVGKRLQNAPRNLFNASLEANYGDWTGTLTGRYTADSYDLATNADWVRGVYGSFDRFWQLDARVSWKPVKFAEVYFAGNNMLGRYYQFTVNPGAFFTAGLKLTY